MYWTLGMGWHGAAWVYAMHIIIVLKRSDDTIARRSLLPFRICRWQSVWFPIYACIFHFFPIFFISFSFESGLAEGTHGRWTDAKWNEMIEPNDFALTKSDWSIEDTCRMSYVHFQFMANSARWTDMDRRRADKVFPLSFSDSFICTASTICSSLFGGGLDAILFHINKSMVPTVDRLSKSKGYCAIPLFDVVQQHTDIDCKCAFSESIFRFCLPSSAREILLHKQNNHLRIWSIHSHFARAQSTVQRTLRSRASMNSSIISNRVNKIVRLIVYLVV